MILTDKIFLFYFILYIVSRLARCGSVHCAVTSFIVFKRIVWRVQTNKMTKIRILKKLDLFNVFVYP